MKTKLAFDPAELESLRTIPIPEVLDLLGLYWKKDLTFQAVKSKDTVRLHISVNTQVFELLVTGLKWFDTRANKGGGGGIDLTMHLFGIGFVSAVERLRGEY